MRNLKSNEKAVYQAIVKCAADVKINARNLIGLLIQSERMRFYRKLGQANLVCRAGFARRIERSRKLDRAL